ncbi:MAG: hypothetical protein CL912_02635 [Deltaproteobacteria bacterium]|nr:hypothetical protein [Deltaproteobacteria bacterium]
MRWTYHSLILISLCHSSRTRSITNLLGKDPTLPIHPVSHITCLLSYRGNGFAAHLDAPAYDHIGEIEHLTANLAVDPATAENGCLQVVPGSHKMYVHFLTGGQIHPDWEHAHEWISVPLEPGKF